MKLTTEEKNILQIHVDLSPEDENYSQCNWADFIVQPSDNSLTIRSDGGNMSYAWDNIGPENFYQFLAKLDSGYLLTKMSSATVFNFDKTVKILLLALNEEKHSDYLRFIREMEPVGNQIEFAHRLLSHKDSHSDDLECVVMDYPAGHRAAIDIFIKYVQPELWKLGGVKDHTS